MWGAPEIVNSDQGSQFTTKKWEELLTYGIKISMDGRGRCKDNIWIERFWRTVKQEYVYINPADTVDELLGGIDKFIKYYNYKRTHQSLSMMMPAMQYGTKVSHLENPFIQRLSQRVCASLTFQKTFYEQ